MPFNPKTYEHNFPCAIAEETADGVPVGRCWFYSPGDVCPRHGDISKVQQHYLETGMLTRESEHANS